jgi:hypothetical protein
MSNISKETVPCHVFNLVGEIQSAFGFYKFYYANLGFYPDRKTCFDFCNFYFKDQFGYYRYNSFDSFSGNAGVENKAVANVLEKPTNLLQCLEREFLLSWFRQCGFDTWTSFKAIVLHSYPEVTEVKLLEFWKNTAIDAKVLIRVNHVKQILG